MIDTFSRPERQALSHSREITTMSEALAALTTAWSLIVDECRAVLGGELHYQAVVYHCLRLTGVPRDQLGTPGVIA